MKEEGSFHDQWSGRAISEYIDFPDFPDHFSQMPEPRLSFKVGLRSPPSRRHRFPITPALASSRALFRQRRNLREILDPSEFTNREFLPCESFLQLHRFTSPIGSIFRHDATLKHLKNGVLAF